MIQQNTPEWEKLRKEKIGASDAPVIMNESPWKTPYQLWQEKLDLLPKGETTWAMKRGHELEPIARKAYNDYTGNCAIPIVVFSEKHDWMMASLDGLSLDQETILEIKCPGKEDHALAKNGEIPKKYWAQLQHQLATINGKQLHYFSYLDGDFALVEVQPDEKYIGTLLKKEKSFIEKVRKYESPALSDKDYAHIQDESWVTAASRWSRLQQQLELLKSEEKQLREELISIANGQSSSGAGIRLQKVIRKGTVDYGAIEALKDIDLERYRKAPIESWRLTCTS